MTNEFWTAFFANVPAMIAALASLIVSVIVASKQNQNTKKIEEIHVATNGMKDALVKSTAKASLAEGIAQGLAQRKPESHTDGSKPL